MKTHQSRGFAGKNLPSLSWPSSFLWISILVLLSAASTGFAQVGPAPAALPSIQEAPTIGAPLTITLQDALQRAKLNDPQYRSAAVTDLGIAREDRVQA